MILSSYDDGSVGGDSPRLIRLFGELENAGTFFAHSFVLCATEEPWEVDDSASNIGDATELSFGVDSIDFVSGDWA